MKVLAIVCVRNEAIHIARCLGDFIEAGIDVFLIDNESSDSTLAQARRFLGRGLVGIDHLPWHGAFSLSDQLSAKRSIAAAVDHDWIIHADADERLHAPAAGQSLLAGIVQADAAGYNCINFHELAFVPLPGEDHFHQDYATTMTTYYFFQPSYPRLNRAWNRRAGLDNVRGAGHLLCGHDKRLCPVDFMLLHYIVLSEAHARSKYLGREYSEEDTARGWHGNRRIITEQNLRLKQAPALRRLAHPASKDYDLGAPVRSHFWEW